MIHRILAIAAAAILLSGCANNFSKFYSDSPVSHNVSLLPYSGKTEVYTSGNFRADAARLLQDGYVRIGIASFQTGGRVTIDQIRSQAKDVGADIVLWSDSYLGAQQSTVPFLQYHPGSTSTTNSFGNVNANANYYGSNGYGTANATANYNGYSTTTTPGTLSVESMPVTIQRYEYTAVFFRKAASWVFGVHVDNLSDDLRQKLQRNAGAVVENVVIESPAFRSNILPGDVIIKLGDWDIYSATQMSDAIAMQRGKTTDVTLIRNGVTKTISVPFNP